MTPTPGQRIWIDGKHPARVEKVHYETRLAQVAIKRGAWEYLLTLPWVSLREEREKAGVR